MNIFRSKILTKIVPLLTARYTILCTRRLQPTRDDCAVRVQWFSCVLYERRIYHVYLKQLKTQLIQILFFPIQSNVIPFVHVFTSFPNEQERLYLSLITHIC